MRAVLIGVAAAAFCAAQAISIDQLKQQIPSSAAREYRASLKALNKGELEQSIAHCRNAIAANPDNASAYNDLGVLYLTNGQTKEALAEFDHATSLQPRFAAAHLNAGFAWLSLDRPEDAEASVRKALDLERNNRRGHLLLGWSLAVQHHYTAAALESLQIASRDFPEAHLAAADLLVHSGSLEGARAEVEAYLATGVTEQKALAEAWLRFLTFE
jgi:tetratricopeptide (TPR) repeat protein